MKSVRKKCRFEPGQISLLRGGGDLGRLEVGIWSGWEWRFGPAKTDTRRRKRHISSQLRVTPPNIHFKYDAIYCLTERSDSSNWIETAKQKANIYTKALGPAQFVSERELVGMIRGRQGR